MASSPHGRERPILLKPTGPHGKALQPRGRRPGKHLRRLASSRALRGDQSVRLVLAGDEEPEAPPFPAASGANGPPREDARGGPALSLVTR